jgi:hypothetical protein
MLSIVDQTYEEVGHGFFCWVCDGWSKQQREYGVSSKEFVLIGVARCISYFGFLDISSPYFPPDRTNFLGNSSIPNKQQVKVKWE